MDRYFDVFNAASLALAERLLAEDRDDYNHATTGADVGRQRRHIRDKDTDPLTGEKRKGGSSAVQRTLDWLLLNDASYSAAHQSAMLALTDAESSVADGLTEIVEALAPARRTLEDMEERAARLPDGTLVFRNANGDVLTADGHLVPDEDAAGVEWRGDEPTYEDYREQRDRIEALEQAERELRGIETELGDIRGELTDQQEPPTEDRVGELEDWASQLSERAGSIRNQAIMDHTAPEQNDLSAEANSIAATEIPDATTIPTINLGSRR